MEKKTNQPSCSGEFKTNDIVKERFDQHFKTLNECINYEKLVPLLCEGSNETAMINLCDSEYLLNPMNSRQSKADCLRHKLESKQCYSKLLEYLKKEEDHLGHSFICSLLEGRHYASVKEIAYSEMIQNAIRQKLTAFIKGINFCELVLQQGFITEDEMQHFSDTTKSRSVILLLNVIETKGPLGYLVFAECLRSEHSHKTHAELYDLIHKDIDVSLLPEPRETNIKCVATVPTRVPYADRLTLHGVLKGDKYNQMICTFQTCQYNGGWTKMEAEASKYLRNGIPHELQIVALLEKAAGLIFQKQDERSLSLISEAKEKCELVLGDNSILLKGRCEYTLSMLHRYTKQYSKAREHAENAQRILFVVEHGHDTAFACLTHASLLIESDGPKAEAECYLRAAISDATKYSTGIDLVGPHARMRMAQLLIGSTHSLRGCNGKSAIQEAEKVLLDIKPDKLSERSKCRLHLIKSSIYRCKKMRPECLEAAICGLDLARKNNYTNEMETASNTLKSLTLPRSRVARDVQTKPKDVYSGKSASGIN